MHAFQDSEGRTWELKVNLGSAQRVLDLLGVNLLELDRGDPPLLTRLGTEEILLCNVIFALVKAQADQLGVSDTAWAEAMGGDAILAAQNALYEELAVFFQSRGRTDLARALATQNRMIALAIEAGERRLEGLDPAKEIESIYGERSTPSPESSESTPVP